MHPVERIEAVSARPVPRLRAYVRRYLGYRYQGFPPGVHLGLPSPSLTVVISLGGPTMVASRVTDRAVGHPALVGGLSTRPVYLPHDGDQYGVQLEVTPAGARALLAVPAAELAGTVVALRDVIGPAAGELTERLIAAPSWAGRFAVLDGVLGRLVSCGEPQPDALAFAWARLVRSDGTVPVAELAAEIGHSRRWLSARFTAEFGLGPKEVARVTRFARSRRMLIATAGAPLARTAAACGYSDQAHLAREWRDLAGVPPSAWLAGEVLPPRGG